MFYVFFVNKSIFKLFFGVLILLFFFLIKFVFLEYIGLRLCVELFVLFEDLGCINLMNFILLYIVLFCLFILLKDLLRGWLVVLLYFWLMLCFRCVNFCFVNWSFIDIIKSSINRIVFKLVSRKLLLIWIVWSVFFVVNIVFFLWIVDFVCIVFLNCVFFLFIVEIFLVKGENCFLIVWELFNIFESKKYCKKYGKLCM